jgi:3-phenylpropionate/trans-cinnamate dioxygenase ferredoxin reductase subunit
MTSARGTSGGDKPPTLAIVGASLAGAKAAEGARDAGFDGRIVLIGEESSVPYVRPPLSKAVLRGEADPDTTHVHPASFYADAGIELVTDRATALDPVSRRVRLAGGDEVAFASAVITTGSTPKRLRAPGADLDGVHYLRTLDDAIRLRDSIRAANRIAVVGAGWLGAEVAASARQQGADVVLIGTSEVPLQSVLGAEVGAVFRDLHAEHGVELRLGTGIDRLLGTKSVEAVALDDGRVEEADVVVVGIGAAPRTELFEGDGRFHIDNGIIVDQFLETTVPGVYAAGDVANAWHPHYERHLRVEHWANALNQGATAGRNAVGQLEPYTRLPYFFSDQYDVGLEYVGHAGTDDTITVRGDLASRSFIVFWHRHAVVTAAMHVNVWDATDDLKAIVEWRQAIEVDRLADPSVALGDLRD